MGNLRGFKDGGGDGLHKMESGLTHTADSQAGGPRGTFISHFGPPGDPTAKATGSSDKGILGSAPKDLLGKYTGNKSQKGRR